MGKMGAYQPPEKYKNYSLSTSKPFKSHAFYKEKVWTIQEQIYKKLKTISQLLEGLHPKLTNNFSSNTKAVIKKDMEILTHDLDLMQSSLRKNPYSFNTNKLKTNQKLINEIRNTCDDLQTVKAYEYEFKRLGKIKHTLSELDHLIQPTELEKSLEKARVKDKPKMVAGKKKRTLVVAKVAKSKAGKKVAKSKKPKAISKKAKPKSKLLKSTKTNPKKPRKSKTFKKVAKPKSKLLAKNNRVLKTKSKSKQIKVRKNANHR